MGKLASGLLVFAGGIWTIGMAWVAANALSAYMRAGDAPAVVKVADAPEKRWVKLEDARVRCDTRKVQGGFTYFVADAPQAEPFLAQLSGDVPCDAAQLDGGFIPGRFTKDWLKGKIGVDLPIERDVRLFTTALAPAYLKGVLFRTIAFLIVGLAVLAIGIRSLRRASRPR
jgi:hypothetical protein